MKMVFVQCENEVFQHICTPPQILQPMSCTQISHRKVALFHECLYEC